jgi:methyl-accepting chemotaxis protein
MAAKMQLLLQEQEAAALEQLANQAEQAEREQQQAQQERKQKEALQQDLLELLTQVEQAAGGNLTVRAEITPGEIGIVADFFNAIIESLQDIVTQVKSAALQVNQSVGENEAAIVTLSGQALQQATQINQLLNSVQAMADSIQQVADNASLAATVAQTAAATAETGGETMELTIANIIELRQVLAETAQKVKRLGESSQQISKVVALIQQISLQTNLLAINASIEAARAGEEGQGFAVVAEEVGQLADRSAAATKEIEQMVENIQLETSEVVAAMEQGTSKVVEGSRLVEATGENLSQIFAILHQIDQLVQSISQSTVSQSQTSRMVQELMESLAQLSERTSTSAGAISHSLQQTAAITKELQTSVETFQVDEQP